MAISALRMGVILLGPLLVNLYVYSSSFYLATVHSFDFSVDSNGWLV